MHCLREVQLQLLVLLLIIKLYLLCSKKEYSIVLQFNIMAIYVKTKKRKKIFEYADFFFFIQTTSRGSHLFAVRQKNTFRLLFHPGNLFQMNETTN